MICNVNFNGTTVDVSEFIKTQEEYDAIMDIFKILNSITGDKPPQNEL